MRIPPGFLALALALAAGCGGVQKRLDRLDDRNSVERQRALIELAHLAAAGRVEDPSEREEVRARTLAALADESGIVRSAALAALPAVAPDQVIPGAMGRAADEDPWVRLEAARLLAARPDTRALPALTDLVRADRDAHVRRAAARALGAGKHQDSVAVLAPVRAALEVAVRHAHAVPEGLELRTDHGPQYTGADCEAFYRAW